jgi:hypothetical protein
MPFVILLCCLARRHLDRPGIDERRIFNLGNAPTLGSRHLAFGSQTTPPPYRNIHRLLFFLRHILHYHSLPDSPVPSLEHIWRPVLVGLHDLTFESDLRMLPNNARIAIWRTIAVIGRQDLLPYSVHGELTADAPRLDYTSVFEEYPVLGGTLRSLIAAITAPGGTVSAELMYRHATASAPALLTSADHKDGQSSELCAVNVGGYRCSAVALVEVDGEDDHLSTHTV